MNGTFLFKYAYFGTFMRSNNLKVTGSASLTKYISRHLTIKDSLTLHKYALTDIRKKCRKKYEWRSEGIKQFKELISSRNLLT